MRNVRSGFLLGLGSNIDPYDNFPKIVSQLLNSFDRIHLSRVQNIPPVGMNSQHFFLNAVAFLETDLSQQELKKICNQIEVALGRDRDDPNSKHKDRPADVDILKHIELPADANMPARQITDEYFLYPLIEELLAYLQHNDIPAIATGSPLTTDGLSFGETATTINRNAHTG